MNTQAMQTETENYTEQTSNSTNEVLDVLVIGAGISGLGMCYTLTNIQRFSKYVVD